MTGLSEGTPVRADLPHHHPDHDHFNGEKGTITDVTPLPFPDSHTYTVEFATTDATETFYTDTHLTPLPYKVTVDADTHHQTTDTLETWDGHEHEVTFNTYGNHAHFTAQFLNTKYDEHIQRLTPDIKTESRLDGRDTRFTTGTVHLEVLDAHNTVLGTRITDISELGHGVKPGYGFCPFVKLDEEPRYDRIDRIDIYINPVVEDDLVTA